MEVPTDKTHYLNVQLTKNMVLTMDFSFILEKFITLIVLVFIFHYCAALFMYFPITFQF